MIDRDAKLTAANLRAAGFRVGWRGTLISVRLNKVSSECRWLIELHRWRSRLNTFIVCFPSGHTAHRWPLPPISTIGELIDWYERLTGREWPKNKEPTP